MNSPKNLILLPKDFKVSGQALINGQWKSFDPFYIERLDDSFLKCGIKAFVPEGAESLSIQIYKCYANEKHHAVFKIKVSEQVLTLCNDYEDTK